MHSAPGPAPSHPIVTVNGGEFWRAGSPHQIVSGAIHYFRVHPDLWEDRLLRLRAMGLNTIETYVAWNVHERVRGQFDFTGAADVARFVTIAGELGLDVILRPGPYICAEWDFGGLPAWLMQDPDAQLRCSDPAYLAAVDAWFDALAPVLTPLLATQGGPIVAVQVENEYGSYGDDAAYLEHCRSGLLARGVDVLLLTSDGTSQDHLDSGSIPGVLATANFGSRPQESLLTLRKFQPEGPDMCMEYWNGWFDHWGEEHHTRDPQDAAQVLDDMLRVGASVNLYMAHGGTNFGLWNGCNIEGGLLQPTVTSYDYDAAVGEAGELTPKFEAFRTVLSRYAAGPLPEAPALPSRLGQQTVEVQEWVSLLDSLDAFDPPVTSPMPRTMEALGQDHGLVLYGGEALVPLEGESLVLDGLADRATVLADGVVIGTVNRNDEAQQVRLTPREDGGRTRIDVLVENQGRINFAGAIGERKGLESIRLAHRFVHTWESTAIRLDRAGLTDTLSFAAAAASAGPLFGRTSIEIEEPADGFIALPGWTKGFVWLNGFLLGRYWCIGPQVTLYAPAALWQAGRNDLVVLELHEAGSSLELRTEPDLGAPA